MNLANKVSAEDRQTVNSMRNHPDFESGFEQDAGVMPDSIPPPNIPPPTNIMFLPK